jgi:hypothetical protein
MSVPPPPGEDHLTAPRGTDTLTLLRASAGVANNPRPARGLQKEAALDGRLKRLQVWCLTTVLACMAQQSFAQIVDIPDAVRQKTGELTPDEKAGIKAFVVEHSKNLESADPLLVKKDRDAILAKLEGGNIGVPFRLEYDSQLHESLTKMLRNENQKTVLNGLVIAGSLATDRSMQLVQGKLGDPAVAIRFEAACSLARTFRAASVPPVAINQQLAPAVRGIGQQLDKEQDPFVRDALIRAAIAATDVPGQQPAAISAIATGTIGSIRAKQGKPLTEPELLTLLRAGTGMRDICTRAVQQGAAVPPNAAKDAAELGGHLLKAVAAQLQGAASPAAVQNREKLAQLAAAAQQTIEFSGQLLTGAPTQITGTLAKDIRENTKAGDARFLESVNQIINEVLRKAPFELPPDKFK